LYRITAETTCHGDVFVEAVHLRGSRAGRGTLNMKKLLAACGASIAIGLFASDLHAQRGLDRGTQEAIRNGWLFDYTQGKAVAAKTGKPLMVVFRCVP